MKHLQMMKKKYLHASAFFTTLAELILGIIYILVKGSNYNLFVLLFSIVFFGYLLFIVNKIIIDKLKNFRNFSKGIKGEEDIAVALQHLDNYYAIYQNVNLGDKLGDIDFVLVGDKNIIALEVKSHSGNIQYDGSKIIKNDAALEKDFLKQTKSSAVRLNHYINNSIGLDIFVEPVLVFSSPHAKVRFLLNKINGVYVIQKDYLDKVFKKIYNESHHIFSKDKVVNILNKLSYEPTN